MRKLLNEFLGWLRFDIADPHERAFCGRWLEHRWTNISSQLLGLMVLFHISGIGQSTLVIGPEARTPFAWYHGIGLLLSIAGVLLARAKPNLSRVLAMVLGTLQPVGYSFAIYSQDYAQTHLVVVTAIVMAAGILGFMCFFPGSTKELFIASVFIDASIGFAYHDFPQASWIVAEFLMIIGFGWIFHLSMVRREGAHGRLEFRLRLKMAPAQIVRQQKDFSEEGLSLNFPNGLKPCVCISSDWRGYQAMSGRMRPVDLAATMQTYYQLVDALLREQFPAGNYFSDWIADELFVVVFAANEDDSTNLANQALLFAQKLLEEKANFAKEMNLELAIDIGISRGTAYLGLLGPDSHKKATALGEIPGRARRLQAAGNLLRATYGNQADRIIFGVEILTAIFLPVDVKTFATDGKRLRDLKDDEVFFVEGPVTAEVAEPATLLKSA